MTVFEKVAVWAIAIIGLLRSFYLKVFPFTSIFIALGFVGGIEVGSINGSNAFPIVIGYTIAALIYFICLLCEKAEQRKYRPRHYRHER